MKKEQGMCDAGSTRLMRQEEGTETKPAQEHRRRRGLSQIKKKVREAKDAWIQQEFQDLEHNLTNQNTKAAYDIVKKLTKPKTGRSSMIKSKEGIQLGTKVEVTQRWKEY